MKQRGTVEVHSDDLESRTTIAFKAYALISKPVPSLIPVVRSAIIMAGYETF
jgi:hypothetical protein